MAGDPPLLSTDGRPPAGAAVDRLVERDRVGAHRAAGGSPARTAAGLEFAEHRRYTPGDDLRRIDWSAYGRLRELLVKTAPSESRMWMSLMIDASRSMDSGEPNKLWYARRLAALLGTIALLRSDSVRVHVLSDGGSVAGGRLDAAGMLSVLAQEIARLPGGTRTELARSVARSRTAGQRTELSVLISDCLVPFADLEGALASWRGPRDRRCWCMCSTPPRRQPAHRRHRAHRPRDRRAAAHPDHRAAARALRRAPRRVPRRARGGVPQGRGVLRGGADHGRPARTAVRDRAHRPAGALRGGRLRPRLSGRRAERAPVRRRAGRRRRPGTPTSASRTNSDQGVLRERQRARDRRPEQPPGPGLRARRPPRAGWRGGRRGEALPPDTAARPARRCSDASPWADSENW